MLPYTFLICTIGCPPDVFVWGSEQRELPTLKTPKWWLGKKAEIASMEKSTTEKICRRMSRSDSYAKKTNKKSFESMAMRSFES